MAVFPPDMAISVNPRALQATPPLAAIAIQSNQNDQHGGSPFRTLITGMAEGVAKTFLRAYRRCLTEAVEDKLDLDDAKEAVAAARAIMEDYQKNGTPRTVEG